MSAEAFVQRRATISASLTAASLTDVQRRALIQLQALLLRDERLAPACQAVVVDLEPLKWEMLIEFITELAHEFKLQSHTAGAACTLFYRFTQLAPESRWCAVEKPELAAAVCLRIAAKFHEVAYPHAHELCASLHESPSSRRPPFGVAELKEAELFILDTLEWKVNILTPHPVLGFLLTLVDEDPSGPTAKRAAALLDMSYHSYWMRAATPAALAGSSLLLACHHVGTHSDAHASLISSLCGVPEARLAEMEWALEDFCRKVCTGQGGPAPALIDSPPP